MTEIIEAVPHQIQDQIASRARLGVIALAADHVMEHELGLVFSRVEGVQLYVTRIAMDPNVSTENLKTMEGRLSAAAETLLPGASLDVIGYGCTSASVMIGEPHVEAAIHAVRPGVPVTTPITAGLEILRVLGAETVGLLTPYIEQVNGPVRAYFEKAGLEVMKSATFSEPDDNRVGLITPASIREAVLDLFADQDIDAMFVSCTNLRAMPIIEELEMALGKPVISSNQALAWHLLRLSGVTEKLDGFGRIFAKTL